MLLAFGLSLKIGDDGLCSATKLHLASALSVGKRPIIKEGENVSRKGTAQIRRKDALERLGRRP